MHLSSPPPQNRVVLTAQGTVSPLGTTAEATLAALQQGKDGITPVSGFDVTNCRCQTAGQIDPKLLNEAHTLYRRARHASPATRQLLLAGAEAHQQAPTFVPETAVFGTTSGGMALGETFLRSAMEGTLRIRSAHCVQEYLPQQPLVNLLHSTGWSIPYSIVSNACASGTNALGHAFLMIRQGHAERVLCGGFDALCQFVFAGFDALHAMTPGKCRPFDAERNGLVLGEGAAVFFMESLDSARRGNRQPIAEILGYGESTDNHHLTQPNPDGRGPQQAMLRALETAGRSAREVDYINAHGTGTAFNDAAEGKAIAALCPQAAVSSSKSQMGHALGAAGALEAAICVHALQRGFLPATIHLEKPDTTLGLRLVANKIEFTPPRLVLSNSLGFGGANATLVLSRFEETHDGTTQTQPARPKKRDAERLIKLSILGTGWAIPFGSGLQQAMSKIHSGVQSHLEYSAQVGPNHSAIPAYRVPAEQVAAACALPRLRRSSMISHLAVTAAIDAMKQAQSKDTLDPKRLAVLFLSSNGGVAYTRRFFSGVLQYGTHAGSPILFPETVYNAPASHLAAHFEVSGPTSTLVGDAASVTHAILLAERWISNGEIDHCLVVAAEEHDWILGVAYDIVGFGARHQIEGASAGALPRKGITIAEGAVAILLGRHGKQNISVAQPAQPFQRAREIASFLPNIFHTLHRALSNDDLEPDHVITSQSGASFDPYEKAALHAFAPNANYHHPLLGTGHLLCAAGLAQIAFGHALLQHTPHLNKPTRALVSLIGLQGQLGALYLTNES